MVLRGLERSLSDQADVWDMTFVHRGEDALAFLDHETCDVIVTDMLMPGMNGAELLNEVVRHYPGVTRIVLSGHADHDLVMQCVGTAHQYLSKPCEPALLIATIERLLALRSMVQSDPVRNLVARLDRLPSRPDLYGKILAALASPRTELAHIGMIVQEDIAMTAKLLKLVNSAFFGIGHSISTANEAVQYLGVDILKALVLSVHVFECCPHLEKAGLHSASMSRQATMTAAAAKAIAHLEHLALAAQEEAFTAGLLHNCGLLVLAENMPEQLAGAIERARAQGLPLGRFEKDQYGATHGQVGGYLLGLWGLPHTIVEAVALHTAGPPWPNPERDTLATVHAAHALVGEHLQTIPGVPTSGLNLDYLRAVGVESRIPAWRDCVADLFASAT
jgi:HD-like signal output (HDOD) protein/CheY-like chemotaxis protein